MAGSKNGPHGPLPPGIAIEFPGCSPPVQISPTPKPTQNMGDPVRQKIDASCPKRGGGFVVKVRMLLDQWRQSPPPS